MGRSAFLTDEEERPIGSPGFFVDRGLIDGTIGFFDGRRGTTNRESWFF
jgi:hypothetical protein